MKFSFMIVALAILGLALVSAGADTSGTYESSRTYETDGNRGANVAPVEPSNPGVQPVDPINVARPTDPPSASPAPVDPNYRSRPSQPVEPSNPGVQPVDPPYSSTNPAPIDPPNPGVQPVDPPYSSTNPAPIDPPTSNNGGNNGGNKNKKSGSDEEGSRRRQSSDDSLELEELSNNAPGEEQRDESQRFGITGAVIGAIGKRGAIGLGILFVVVGIVGLLVYNRQRFGLVK